MDLEMARIIEVLTAVGAEMINKNLAWGAKASDYAEEIATAVAAGKVPVIIELTVDCDLPAGTVNVDHHNDRAGEPASIIQVLALIGVEPTRHDLLVAANDSGFIDGMVAFGATVEEVADILALKRRGGGIGPEKEAEAIRAIAERTINGRLTVVRMEHSKTGTVTERLHAGAGGEGYDQLLVLSGDGEVNFFGDGALCASLKEKFEGWSGGSGLGKIGENAFWGGYPNHDEVLSFIEAFLA